MSVNSYLTDLASGLVLSFSQGVDIETSISTISTRLDSYFGNAITSHFKFGSSARGTILPRKADSNSDIDYMVVFAVSGGLKRPQTYLDRLRRFADSMYSTSEVHQSHPTLVLSLNHINFELVPALPQSFGYQIPSPSSNWTDWMNINPNEFNQKLTEKNESHNERIKPLVRLVKYWNATNGHPFASFALEYYICSRFYSCSSLKDYFYLFWDGLSCTPDSSQAAKDKVALAKERVNAAKEYERSGDPSLAQSEIEKVVPPLRRFL